MTAMIEFRVWRRLRRGTAARALPFIVQRAGAEPRGCLVAPQRGAPRRKAIPP